MKRIAFPIASKPATTPIQGIGYLAALTTLVAQAAPDGGHPSRAVRSAAPGRA